VKNSRIRVLITGPSLQDQGGVANYYNAVYPRLTNEAISVDYLEIGSTHGRGRVMHTIIDQVRFWRTLGRLDPHIVHLNPSLDLKSFLRDGVFIFLAKLRRRSILVFFRGWQEPFEIMVTGRFRWFFKLTYARADCFVVLAKVFAERLRDWGITKPVHIGTTVVADELLNELSIEKKVNSILRAENIRLVYLARLERQKGIMELIAAVEILLDRGVSLSLTIAGDGPLMSQVRRRVATLGQHQDKVTVVGYVRGLMKAEILRSHHVYCLPTQYGEGMPNSVLEAMGMGMPVVTCPVGGIADFFQNHKMGALLETTEPNSMANSIGSLIANRDNLATIATYNHSYARRHFLASTAAETLRAWYRNMDVFDEA